MMIGLLVIGFIVLLSIALPCPLTLADRLASGQLICPRDVGSPADVVRRIQPYGQRRSSEWELRALLVGTPTQLRQDATVTRP
jgi:hypothetical protein